MNFDAPLLTAFETGEVDNAGFSHARHVQVAWMLSRRYPRIEAFERLTAGLRGIAARAGRPQAFHHTVTRAWFELIASVDDPDDYPEIFDKSLLSRYYSVERLAAGREAWLEPDLHRLCLPAPSNERQHDDDLRLLSRIPASVMVVAAHRTGQVHASTISSFSTVSRRPSLISICLANQSRTLKLLEAGGAFIVSVLAMDQDPVATRFADSSRPDGPCQFDGIPHHLNAYGPAIEGASAWIGCNVIEAQPWGDHHMVLGEVRFVEFTGRRPLLRHDGRYH